MGSLRSSASNAGDYAPPATHSAVPFARTRQTSGEMHRIAAHGVKAHVKLDPSGNGRQMSGAMHRATEHGLKRVAAPSSAPPPLFPEGHRPAARGSEHPPPEQVPPSPHASPHPPQFAGSVIVSTQAASHS